MKFGNTPATRAEDVPCPHMKNLISPLVDGNLGGIMGWYAHSHVKGCVHCTAAYESMTAVRRQIATLGTFMAGSEAADSDTTIALTAERRATLNNLMDRLDAAVATPQAD